MNYLKLKSGTTVTLATIKVVITRSLNQTKEIALTPILSNEQGDDKIRFAHTPATPATPGEEDEISFVIRNCTGFDLSINIFNTNNDPINKINLLRPYQKIVISRNELTKSSMILEEYLNCGKNLMFDDEKKRCLSSIQIGFDRSFGMTFEWEVSSDDYRRVETDSFRSEDRNRTTDDNYRFQMNSLSFRDEGRLETDGIALKDTSRALLKPGKYLEDVKCQSTKTSEKFYASISYDFGIVKTHPLQTKFVAQTECKQCQEAKDSMNGGVFKETGLFLIACDACVDKKRFSTVYCSNEKIMVVKIE